MLVVRVFEVGICQVGLGTTWNDTKFWKDRSFETTSAALSSVS